MRKIIRFTKSRFIMITISIVIILTGVVGTFLTDGFNMGIDFKAGLTIRLQIAPKALGIQYTGKGTCELNVNGNGIILTVQNPGEEAVLTTLQFTDYPDLAVLTAALRNVPSLIVTPDIKLEGSLGSTGSVGILGLNHPVTLSSDLFYINIAVPNETAMFASIDKVRNSLNAIGVDQIQVVGNLVNQEYILKIQDDGTDLNFNANAPKKIITALESSFGAGSIVVKQTDYVGPRFSQSLGSQSIYLLSFSLALILVYIWFRFKLAYAVGAIGALIHDVTIMIGFIGITGMEINTGTIAAVLTIIGYSLNDTIVIYDRIRENVGLMRDSELSMIIDTSISQSLSRTLMTSLTTLLAVLAIYIFGTGVIKDFSLALIIGIIVGTYSSIFIASPIFLGWSNTVEKRKKRKETQKYGRKIVPVKSGSITMETENKEKSMPPQKDTVDNKVVSINSGGLSPKKKKKKKKK